MKNTKPGYLEGETFECVIEHTPLVSVDLIVKQQEKVLLGKRVNPPAKGFWFTLGGRVLKNERITEAISRISNEELGMDPVTPTNFIGVFEHLYDDGIFDGVSTHYLNLAYEIGIADTENLPRDQHDAYRWFTIEELLQSSEVHSYVKDYFTKEKGTIPQ